jgi:hypothetical protein
VEFQSESAPTPTPTPTISPTPTPTPISIQCPPYYTQSTAGGVTYCHQFFRSTTFPFSHECKTYNSASVDDNDDTHCGSAHIEAGNNGYQYFNFDGFSYQEATNNWKQMVYPSEITELRYYVFFANRIYDYCTPWFMTPSGIYTAQAAAVSQDDDGNEGWYRHFDLDKELFQEIQPSGIAISCDNSGDILQYNYGNDTTYNRPLTFAMLSFTYPSFASLSGSIYEATGSAEPLEIGDCEALDFACYIGRFLDWVKYLIAQFKSWLASLYQIESPYDLMVEQRDLMLEVMAYKTPFAYIIALQNIDWSTVLTSEADIDTIPIIDIPIVTYSFITHTATTTGSLYYDFNASTPLNNQALYYREIMYNFLKIIIGIIFIFWLVFTFSQQVRMIIFGR